MLEMLKRKQLLPVCRRKLRSLKPLQGNQNCIELLESCCVPVPLKFFMKFDILSLCCYRYGEIYLKSAKSCMDKGADYAKNEIQRLDRILAKVSPLYTSRVICQVLVTLFSLCFEALPEHYFCSQNVGLSNISFLVSSIL